MEIKQSLNPEGEPRIDWTQKQLSLIGSEPNYWFIVVFLVSGTLITLAFDFWVHRDVPQNWWNRDFQLILGFVCFGLWFGYPAGIFFGYLAQQLAMGGRKDLDGIYATREHKCFMFLSREDNEIYLCFITEKSDHDACARKQLPYLQRRINGPLAFSVISGAEWEMAAAPNANTRIEKLVLCDFGGGEIIVAGRNYGPQWQVNDLRLAMQRNFGDAWRVSRRLPDTASRGFMDAAPVPVAAAAPMPRKVRRFEDDDVI